MFLGLLDSDPDSLVRVMDPDPDPPTVLLLIFDFLSLKNDVNAPSKSNKQNNFLNKIVLKVNDENSRIRIPSKMSWIRNTAENVFPFIFSIVCVRSDRICNFGSPAPIFHIFYRT
jgi:hypothetical protein